MRNWRSLASNDLTRAERNMRFVESFLNIPEGSNVGRPFNLLPFQEAFIYSIYDNPNLTNRAFVSLSRKNGKSALIAALLLAHIVGPEAKQNSQIISGARSRDQASLVFKLAEKMVRQSPGLQKIVRIVPSQKSLIGLPMNVEYRAISAEAGTAHGLSPVLAILDEVGQVRGTQDDFIDAIVTAQGAYDDPLLIAISTQSPNDADLFSIWLDDAKASKDPRIVCHLYEGPKDCELLDESAWRAANPALGLFRSFDDVREQAERATRMPSSEPTFRNLILNQRVEMSAPFISRGVWTLNSHEADDSVFYTEPVYCGLDLSAKNDLTAFVMIAFKERWHVKCIFWTPQKGLRDRAKKDRAPYDVWEQQGFIRAVPGASIDYDPVALEIAETLADCNVQAIAFDRWRIDVFKKSLEATNVELPLVPFGQGFASMAPAIDALESELLNERMAHGANPVLTMCMANARIEQDAAGNRKLSKTKATGRIDGAVALTMAMGAASSNQKEETKEYQFIVI